MLEQLEAIRERFLEVEQQIAMPEVVSDLKKFKTLSKEYKLSLIHISEPTRPY